MSEVYADGHVHIHPGYDVGRLLGRGEKIARSLGAPLVLLLVDDRPRRAFVELRDARRIGSFELRRTSEPTSLSVVGDAAVDSPCVFLVSGRQLVSVERLEVLVIGLRPDHPLYRTADGACSTADLVGAGLGAGAITVLPWGFGKWLGIRGRCVDEILAQPGIGDDPLFFVGDILARCWPWPRPRSFAGPARVLPGTDMLPLRGFESRLASYGFRLQGELDRDRPAASLIALLRERAPLEPFGRPDGTLRAGIDQLRYRLRGRDVGKLKASP